MTLSGSGQEALTLIEDVENLCGVSTRWSGDEDLYVRAPLARQAQVKVKDGQAWGPVRIHVELHEEAVIMRRSSEDLARTLFVIGDCEQTRWNLYLRRAGEPLYNDAMANGWDDPDVFGGFAWDQSVASLEWTGPRQARIVVHGGRYKVTVREKVGDVRMQWVFTNKDAPPKTVIAMPLPLIRVENAKK